MRLKKRTHHKWAAKLIRSKNFVVMTDGESAICFQGLDPSKFTDMLMLEAQSAELELFTDKLNELRSKHRAAIRKLSKTSKVTRIKVKETN